MTIRVFLQKAILAVGIGLLIIGLCVGIIGNLEHKSYLAAFAVSVLFAALSLMLVKRQPGCLAFFEKLEPITECVILSLLCFLINGIWVLFFHPIQAADYKTFFQAAVDLANHTQLSGKDYLAMFPHILGYAFFLSLFFGLLGNSVLLAAIINVMLTTASGVLLYCLSLRYTRKKAAASFVFLLWTVCPSKFLFNTMVLSEPYYTFLLLFFLMMTSVALDGESSNRLKQKSDGITLEAFFIGILCGFLIAVLNTARPIGIIPVIAVFIWCLFLTKQGQRLARWVFFLTLLFGYVVTGRAWTSYAAEQLGQKPPSVPGYSIYVGFNLETQGSYSDDDMDLLQSRYFGEYDKNAKQTQQSMYESAKERIAGGKQSLPSLMIQKLGTLLGHDEAGAFYSKESLSPKAYALFCILSNTWYYFVCLFAIIGSCMLWKYDQSDRSNWLVPLCIVGVILAQLLVEVAARYHYCIIPMLLLLASFFKVQAPQQE